MPCQSGADRRLTLQSTHFPNPAFPLPSTPPAAAGFAYGDARALDVKSLFSPILRVDEEGWNGSIAATVVSFWRVSEWCCLDAAVAILWRSYKVWCVRGLRMLTFSHFLQTILSIVGGPVRGRCIWEIREQVVITTYLPWSGNVLPVCHPIAQYCRQRRTEYIHADNLLD
jgi:hypothetical protein